MAALCFGCNCKNRTKPLLQMGTGAPCHVMVDCACTRHSLPLHRTSVLLWLNMAQQRPAKACTACLPCCSTPVVPVTA